MIRLLTILLTICIVFPACSQSLTSKSKKAVSLFREADNFRVRGQFPQAIDLFNQALAKDDEFAEAWYLLGITYKMSYEIDKSIEHFEKALDLFPTGKVPPELHFELGQVYLYQGDYQKAGFQMSAYINRGARDPRDARVARKALLDVDYALKNSDKDVSITPKELSQNVNGFKMQYFPVLTADQRILIFTKRGPSDDEDLVVSSKMPNGDWSPAGGISPNINSRWNEGTCTVSADARSLIFTSCQGRVGMGSCDLFISYREGSEWSIPINMGSNVNSRYWDSQPSLSTDGRTLYFVSARPGGLGGKDIWISKQDKEGIWMAPENAGTGINTPLDEVSPFIHANNSTLYFASDGYPGYGGFDIYYTQLPEQWEFPLNLGNAINNAKDQLSLFITADGKEGYYSDESAGGGGINSKIFSFTVPEELRVKYRANYVFGTIIDSLTRKPLSASIELFNLSIDEPVSVVTSDPITGSYLMVLPEGAEYGVYVNGEGYLFESMAFNYNEQVDIAPVNHDFELKKSVAGSSIVLTNLFFDVAEFALQPKSKVELGKVISYLTQNQKIAIEISGHTDNTGSPQFNKTLSLNRAKSVADYLIANGIESSRIKYLGKGESSPRFPNDSEYNKAQNRRIEMRILAN